mgnify:CR=1 FL=1
MRIEIDISSDDEKLLLNDLLSIQDWANGMVIGKVNQCWKRFRTEWVSKLMDDDSVSSIPADKSGLISLVMSRSDYKNRQDRE